MSLKRLTLNKHTHQLPDDKYYSIPSSLKILRTILNPNHQILNNSCLQNYSRAELDLRKPQSLKLGTWQIIHLCRVLVVILLDSVMIFSAVILANQIVNPIDNYLSLGLEGQNFNFLINTIVINLIILYASKLYGIDRQSRSYTNLFKSITLAYIVLLLEVYLVHLSISPYFVSLSWLLTAVLVVGERFILNSTIDNIRKKIPELRRNVLLIGNKQDIIQAKKILETHQTFKIVNVIELFSPNHLIESSQLIKAIALHEVDEVLICSWEYLANPIALLWELNCAGISWRIMSVWLNLPLQWTDISLIEDIPTFRFNSAAIIGVDFWCKRAFDIVVSILLLFILSGPMLISAILIKLDSPGSVFYKQTRVGLKGKCFQVWKFRTMVENASELQKQLEAKNEVKGGVLFKIKDDPRITKVGRFLRRYSLDELPQLFNVLQGDMSLVGPRPLPVRDVEKFSQHHFFRHEVLPGITGLWQVSGRSDIENSEEVFKLDFAYIKNWSLTLDLKILLQTFQVVVTSKGAY
ncbi:exopolysaccharide biosynthesis polyprenyl glycosylphosphotransferase [Stanieria cyanosphaera PCC 7437]|uniref:Exopolysaccharide biosynthesis polyprenyl glycosylphosphotransferase n=1 Tax=Stanieria cyanosphaera (strain ATCC 29371 / PCC 7437) TaxID=111780 RepID=K9XR54_STAC7|nr:sugar transferase [Stanieria cyanosphaera]AFZ35023.1 exopolysaccharide biosynthesis polyprenyl glycosylphosphotransferase [Stanieria cyanosphaera PCC 7437]